MSEDGLIDFHSHYVTDRYVEQAIRAGVTQPDGMPSWPTWSPAEHLRLMDRHHIDRAVLSVSTPGVHYGDDAAAIDPAKHVNDYAAASVGDHPDR